MGCTATAKLDGEPAPPTRPVNDNAVPGGRVAWYRNYHRYYDPAIGRYTQVDPASLFAPSLGAASTLAYAYAENSPLTLVDPTGLWSTDGKCFGLPSEEDVRAAADTITKPQLKRCVIGMIKDAEIDCGGCKTLWDCFWDPRLKAGP